MDSVARILELIVDFLKRNYKKPNFGLQYWESWYLLS